MSSSKGDNKSDGGSQQSGKSFGKGGNLQRKPKKDVDEYVGHTAELTCLITNDGNKANQFKELIERLSTYASSEYSADVGTSIEEMETASIKEFMPNPIKDSMWKTLRTNTDGSPAHDSEGNRLYDEDTGAKTMLDKMQEQMIKKQTDAYTEYVAGLRAMFRITLGQVDHSIKSKLESTTGWKAVKSGMDTVGLLSMLRVLCYQDARTSVHRMTNIIRVQRKLITSRQRDDDCGAFVREVEQRFKVFKALGGSVLFPEVIEASMYSEQINLASYNKLTTEEREEYNLRAEQRYLAALIVEGCDEETSTLRQKLAQQFALGSNLYPNTTSRAQEMLIEFAGTRQKTKSTGGGNSGKQQGNGKRHDKDRNKKSDAKSDKTDKKSDDTKNTNRDIQGAQVLMQGIASGENFNPNDGNIFFQVGQVNHERQSTDTESEASMASQDSADDWDFWLEKDNTNYNSDESDDGCEPHEELTVPNLLSPHKSTYTKPPSDTISDISPLTTDVSTALQKRSEPTQATHTSQTLIATACNTYAEVLKAPPPKSGSIEPPPQQSPSNTEPINHRHRPDPPGTAIADLPNKGRGDKPRSGAHTMLEPRSGAHTMLVGPRTKNNKGGGSLMALDLAVNDWQRSAIIGLTTEFEYSRGINHMFAQSRGGINPNWLLLDSESSVNLIVNRQLLTNIRVAENGASLTVHCNAGTTQTNLIGDMNGFGTVWFYEDGIANVISLGLVTNKFRVTMDSDIDNAMYIHKPNGNIRRFSKGENNLYYYNTSDAASTETLLTITTVKGQKELFSGMDRKRADRARKLQEIMGYPSEKDFLRMIDNKVMKNCAVTRRDVQIAQQIYGKGRAIIQGKTVRRQVPHVREDILPVPDSVLKNYREITLSVDVFHVNGVRFLVTISRHLSFRTVRALNNMRKSTLLNAIKTTIGTYESRGFTVKTIAADNQFECLRDDLMGLNNPVNLNTTATDEHEPFIERSNRTVKERIRCIFNNTPFKRMPIRMVTEMVYSAVFWLNSLIPEHGVSVTMSPRELMTGVSLDANTHGRFQFGEYVMAHQDETNNSLDPRALDTIYLRPSGNVQGGYWAYDVNSAHRVHRMHGTAMPMTDSIIERINSLGKEYPEGIIFGDANNENTILDFDITENEDDDDVSDASFQPDDDDESIDSTVSDTTDVTEVSERMDEEHHPHIDETGGDPHQDNGEAIDPPEGDDADEDHRDDVNETNRVSEHEESDEDETEGTSNHGETDEEDTGDDEDSAKPNEPRRVGLRPSVRRTHNKFNESDGYETNVINRTSMFTAGYGPALNKIGHDEIGYMNTAAAIMEYNNIDASQVTKQYGVKQGIKMFGEDGVDAVLTELKQLHDRTVVSPINPKLMTKEMRDKALPYLMFLKRKRCGKIKGRGCADGRRQREFISKEEASSPTVALHALMVSCLIDAIEGRDVATADIPGAFLQTEMPEGEDVYIRLDGTMADLLCRLDPKLYKPCMIDRGKGRKLLYAKANKAIYGTLRAALLFWENLSGKLADWGFEMNPYDPCTMNKNIKGSQATICWHVDDLKISHKDPAVVTSILNDLNKEYGKISPLTVTRGKIHDYVGMTIDFSEAGKVKFSMFDYLEEIIQNLPKEFVGESNTPASNHLFTIDEDGEKLSEEMADKFHHYVAKLLFMAKRTRPDIGTAIAFLCTRVKSPDVHDWKKLGRVMKYLQLTPFLPLVLGWNGTGDVYWYVDASFAVHKDMRSHTGGMMTLGQGAVISSSTKQKINTKSSTEAELVGVDDVLNLQVWTRYFINAQFEHAGNDLLMKKDRLYQDNTSTMRLEKNGKASSTKRTRHIDIRYFFITDRVKAGKVEIEYCPTEEMMADFFTKPLQGSLFRKHRNNVMGMTPEEFTKYKDAYMDAKRRRTVNPNSDEIG